MGSCVSLSSSAAAAELGDVVAMATVVDLDGSVAQLAAPATAGEALGVGVVGERRRASSSCFVCSSDELRFDAPARAMAAGEALAAGQLYFVLPLSMLRRPLSGQDMAALAVKASATVVVVASPPRRRRRKLRAAGKLRRQPARVVPLVVVSGGDEGTVGKTTNGAAYRSGTRQYI